MPSGKSILIGILKGIFVQRQNKDCDLYRLCDIAG